MAGRRNATSWIASAEITTLVETAIEQYFMWVHTGDRPSSAALPCDVPLGHVTYLEHQKFKESETRTDLDCLKRAQWQIRHLGATTPNVAKQLMHYYCRDEGVYTLKRQDNIKYYFISRFKFYEENVHLYMYDFDQSAFIQITGKSLYTLYFWSSIYSATGHV